jgi:hypothetical protein
VAIHRGVGYWSIVRLYLKLCTFRKHKLALLVPKCQEFLSRLFSCLPRTLHKVQIGKHNPALCTEPVLWFTRAGR